MYLVIGANGFLGSYILKNIIDNTSDEIVAVCRNIDKVTKNPRIKWESCDVSNEAEVSHLCNKYNNISKKVIYLAAYHNPDLVEKNPDLARNINIISLEKFLEKIKNVACLFYPSTDSVYGDSINNYHFKETDELNPVNTYGKQKCEAEKIILNYGYNVVRYPFLIDKSLSPVKKHFCDIIIDTLQSNNKIEMFSDSYRSSLNFDTAAALLIRLMESFSNSIPKVLNICGDDDLSKYDVGCMLADSLGVSRTLIVPVQVEQTNGIYETKRAISTLMDNTLLKKTLGIKEIKLRF